jgi:hypothetical protein
MEAVGVPHNQFAGQSTLTKSEFTYKSDTIPTTHTATSHYAIQLINVISLFEKNEVPIHYLIVRYRKKKATELLLLFECGAKSFENYRNRSSGTKDLRKIPFNLKCGITHVQTFYETDGIMQISELLIIENCSSMK